MEKTCNNCSNYTKPHEESRCYWCEDLSEWEKIKNKGKDVFIDRESNTIWTKIKMKLNLKSTNKEFEI